MPAFRRQSAQRRRTLWRQRTARTAKPCGPGRRCYGQALANAAVAPTGAVPATFAGAREARRNSAPGRARHKLSDHRAGKAVCWASPVCCCAVLPACAFRAADRGCRRHSAFPAPSWLRGWRDQVKLGRVEPRGREAVSASRDVCWGMAMLRSTPSLRGALATKQSRISPRRDSGLRRFARNDEWKPRASHSAFVPRTQRLRRSIGSNVLAAVDVDLGAVDVG